MVVIEAPYPGLISRIELPAPDLGDETNVIASVNLHEMADGSVRTIIRQPRKKQYRYTFRTTEAKARELNMFLAAYSDKIMLYQGRAVYSEQESIESSPEERDFVTFSLKFRDA